MIGWGEHAHGDSESERMRMLRLEQFLESFPFLSAKIHRRLLITLHNVLGRTRPVVPVVIEPFAVVRGAAGSRELPMQPGCIFVFAEDIAPGSHRTLACHAPRLLETLPCPRGLLAGITFRVWLPMANAATPDPLPTSAAVAA